MFIDSFEQGIWGRGGEKGVGLLEWSVRQSGEIAVTSVSTEAALSRDHLREQRNVGRARSGGTLADAMAPPERHNPSRGGGGGGTPCGRIAQTPKPVSNWEELGAKCHFDARSRRGGEWPGAAHLHLRVRQVCTHRGKPVSRR